MNLWDNDLGTYKPPPTIQTRKVWFDVGYFNVVIYTVLY